MTIVLATDRSMILQLLVLPVLFWDVMFGGVFLIMLSCGEGSWVVDT